VVSLRTCGARSFSLEALRDAGSVPPDGVQFLGALVAARCAFLVSGGTGAGKTTVLAALLSEVDRAERLVLVEDASELRPDHPHVVGLEARPPNAEGAGEITLRTLVRQALRMRPDRLVVGEVRGAEVVDMLAALNTGHAGGCATVHANSAADVPARLEALALAAGLGREAVHSQVAAAVDAVIHVSRGEQGVRRVEEVAVPVRGADGLVAMQTAAHLDPRGLRPGPAWDRFAARLGLP
jgi:pilus assembly protein CpaF